MPPNSVAPGLATWMLEAPEHLSRVVSWQTTFGILVDPSLTRVAHQLRAHPWMVANSPEKLFLGR